MDDSASQSGESGPGPDPSPTPFRPAPASPSAGGGSISTAKLFAILSYALCFMGVPFCIVPLIMRDHAFSLFHGKQATGLACIQLLAGVFWLLSILVSVLFPPMMCLAIPVVFGVGIGAVVLHIIALVNAASDKVATVPLFGKLIDDAFKGLKVKPSIG